MVKNIKIKIILSLIVILLCASFFFLYTKINIFIPCLFHQITGLYCPGCGITRCLVSIIKLDFIQAFRYNMLVFILMPLFIFIGIKKYYCWILNKQCIIFSNRFYVFLVVITILFGILRNIFPFLAPTIIWILLNYIV